MGDSSERSPLVRRARKERVNARWNVSTPARRLVRRATARPRSPGTVCGILRSAERVAAAHAGAERSMSAEAQPRTAEAAEPSRLARRLGLGDAVVVGLA